MPSKKKTLAQTSLEYLITYGWAMVLIATIIGVLVFAAGGGINTNTCTTFLSMICKGIGADGDTLYLVLQNATGQKITINPFVDIRFDDKLGYAEVTYRGTVYRFEDVTINPGDEFTIEGQGMALAETLSITYYEHATGITRTLTSTLGSDAPPDIELSNDGIDNDGDGLVDCAELSLTDCEYTVEATTGFPTTIGSVWEKISFGKVKGHGGTELAGDWHAENSVVLAFYVESFISGTTADVRFAGPVNITTIDLKQGWNAAEITLVASELLSGAGIPDFEIISNGAPFTIANNPLPKAILIVNP